VLPQDLDNILSKNKELFFEEQVSNNNYKTKIIFITHSDVAYANYYIEKHYKVFYKILTVNNYTINKLSKLLNIKEKKFYKIINYIEKKENINILKDLNKKTKKFGVLSRFSEDKNIPMLIYSLIILQFPSFLLYVQLEEESKVQSHSDWHPTIQMLL
jgi:glycosyltransferase involved in cell wall biosynthesis